MFVSHRALRSHLRDIDGYRELSDAIRAEVNAAAPKEPQADQILSALGWVSADPEAYAHLNRVRRELIRTILWTDATRVIAGTAQHDDTEIRKAASKLAKDISASVIAKQALGLIQPINEDGDIDNEGGF